MKMRVLVLLFLPLMLCCCSKKDRYEDLRKELAEFISDKDASIGVAVIIDGRDTVAVNGDKEFPMLSVYKFPIALAFGEYCRQHDLPLSFPVSIVKEDLHLDTYSPMTERILASSQVVVDSLELPSNMLLGYMLQMSDNNASDILLKSMSGVDYVKEYLDGLGITDINVRSTEQEMHSDNALCSVNSSTPIAMACLMDRFDREFNDSISYEIKQLMETCETGKNRLVKPFLLSDAVIGHKTGTGFILPDGRLMAVNDAAYVHLSDGPRYAIAVFVEKSGYDMEQTEALIAEISRLVWMAISNNYQK